GPDPAVLCALTTTAPVQRPPWVEISGPGGTWRLSYTEDLSWRTGPDGELTEHRHSRTDLVENLLTHVRDPQTALLSPLEASGPFSAVLEAIQSAPDPTVIDPEHVTWIGEGQAAHPVVDDIGDALHTALETGTAFSRNGVSWACADAITTWRPREPTRPPPPEPMAEARPRRSQHDPANRPVVGRRDPLRRRQHPAGDRPRRRPAVRLRGHRDRRRGPAAAGGAPVGRQCRGAARGLRGAAPPADRGVDHLGRHRGPAGP